MPADAEPPTLLSLSCDLLEVVLSRLDAADLARAARASAKLRAVAAQPECWRGAASRIVDNVESIWSPSGVRGLPFVVPDVWRSLCVVVASGLLAREAGTLLPVIVPHYSQLSCDVAASSCDRPEEKAENVLLPSYCYSSWPPNRCGCWQGTRPCYWSSAPIADPTSSTETLTFSLPREGIVAAVTSVSVRAYQAHWHPNAPIYAPREVSLRFHGTAADGTPFAVESARTQFEARSQELIVTLERPLVLPWSRTTMTLSLHGAVQAYTGTADGAHYVCLSAVRVFGAVLLERDLESEAAKMGWQPGNCPGSWRLGVSGRCVPEV